MAEAASDTRTQLELTRESLSNNVDRLVGRVKHELDWKRRLRQDLPQIAAIGGAIVIAGVGVVMLRRRFGKRTRDGFAVDDFSTMDLHDLAKELRAIKQEIEKTREQSGGPGMKLATAILSAAAAEGGRRAADRVSTWAQEEPAAPAVAAAT